MTAKQRANRLRFKSAIAEAAKIRAKNPKLTQAEAVKKAWAIIYTKKKPAKKIGTTDIEYKGFKIVKTEEGYQVLDNKGYDIAGEYFKTLKLAKSAADDEIENSMGAVKKTARKTARKPAKKTAAKSYHKDTKSHNVNIRVISGYKKTVRKGKKTTVHYTSIGNAPKYKDADMARELQLYAESDSALYFQQRRPILINLGKKYKKGTYDIDKAAKLWRYFIDNALKKYNKEFGSRGDKWFELMTTSDRQLLALEMATETKNEFDLGNFTN